MKHLLLIALTLFCLASCQDDTLPTSEKQSPVHQTGIDNSTVYVPDVLYVKLTEAAADAPSKTELTARMGATDMRRVFPPAGKFRVCRTCSKNNTASGKNNSHPPSLYA